MIPAELPENETERLDALYRYAVLDTEAEQDFDELVRLASYICEVPISLVSLVDSARQWFKAKVGLGASETPRDLAFCAHVILQNDIMEVEDATKDERFHDNPLVVGSPDIRFYAGVPLTTSDGFNLGTLCVIDTAPRHLTERQKDALRTLGKQVIMHLELRYKIAELSVKQNQLEQTISELKTTQNHLIESEKMASLGQLVAGIAHEINNPLGAINASSHHISQALKETIAHLPAFFREATEDSLEVFNRLTNVGLHKNWRLSTREERQAKRSWADILEQNQIADAEGLSESLTEIGLQPQEFEGYKSALQSPDFPVALAMAERIVSLSTSAQVIHQSVQRAGKIVFALKKFSHQSSEGEMMLTDIAETVETVLTIYENFIKQGVVLNCYFDDVPMILGYPDELSQVWTNLIYNALQAMDFRGKLDLTIARAGAEICVSVRDSGKGIPEELKGRVFDAFFTTKPAGEGTGLGLSITKKIVEKHNGRITLESTAGVGTTFSVFLPIS